MGITVTVRDQSSTGRATGAVELEDIPSAITLRDLIRTRVREEVARYNAADAGALPTGWGYWTIWQYDNGGSLPGDQNLFNGSLAQLKEFARGS